MAVKIFNVINKGIRIRENGVFTAPELVTDAGVFFEEAGGYYAGGNILVDGKEYAIFVEPRNGSPALSGEFFSGTPYVINGSNSPYNGRLNTQNMVDNYDENTINPVSYCINSSTNGFNDWHLPSIEELDICYRYLKPTTEANFVDGSLSSFSDRSINQYSNPYGNEYTSSNPSRTTVIEFQQGNSEAFNVFSGDYAAYFSSTITNVINLHRFTDGFPTSYPTTTDDRSFMYRAVRWVEV